MIAGCIIMLIGVAILAIPFFNGSQTNTSLTIGLLVVIAGFISGILISKIRNR